MSIESTNHVTKASAGKAAEASHDSDSDGHGNSPAAWTAVVIMLVAFAVGTIAFCADVPIVVWIAAGFIVIGALVGLVLKKMGYGVGGARYVPKAHQ
ncbi:hypothetical protein EDF39_2739 [Frondihabitans sp. PhB161]|nr:hypothetical protein EDF37_2671 [Frondihabitans sp. PhB153]RPF04316.1 hypothetical protein EDF39_2739 [Frondihabitans sp. PhB161]